MFFWIETQKEPVSRILFPFLLLFQRFFTVPDFEDPINLYKNIPVNEILSSAPSQSAEDLMYSFSLSIALFYCRDSLISSLMHSHTAQYGKQDKD